MRISDWSSDVCSSDLRANLLYRTLRFLGRAREQGALGLRVERFEQHQLFARRLEAADRLARGLEFFGEARFDAVGRRPAGILRDALADQDHHRPIIEPVLAKAAAARFERAKSTDERRGGKEGVSTGRSRGLP